MQVFQRSESALAAVSRHLTELAVDTVLPSHASQHRVQFGETLSDIAVSHGLSLARLLEENPAIVNPDVVYPGQLIAIPQSDAGALDLSERVAEGLMPMHRSQVLQPPVFQLINQIGASGATDSAVPAGFIPPEPVQAPDEVIKGHTQYAATN